MKRAVLFDLDGTLVDSAPDIAAAINCGLASQGLGPLGVDAITPMLGAGARAAVARAISACGAEPDDTPLAERTHTAYIAAYEATPYRHTALYPGCRTALDRLRSDGWTLGIVTNKPEQVTRALVAALELDHLFAVVIGARDGVPLKPAPDMLHLALADLGIAAANTIFVGDSQADVGAARSAGVPVILLSHGYTTIPARNLGADAVIDHFDELLAALSSLQAA